jgi:hypothetical protein
MNIYVCIIPENNFSRAADLPRAATCDDIGNCGALIMLPVSPLRGGENLQKNAKIFATSTPTPPCACMNAIHLARRVMHKQRLAQPLSASRGKFPSAATKSPEFSESTIGGP